MKDDIIKAHQFSINNKAALVNDSKCGCFYCMSIYDPSEIEECVIDSEETALCPYCGIDSVIGESSGYPITKEFLTKMNKYWFGE